MLDVIIITGASKGIGKNIAVKCSSICKNIILLSSSDDIYNIDGLNENCYAFPLKLDLHDYKTVERVVKTEISKFSNINKLGIVLAGAQLGEHGGLFKSDLSRWENLYKCNVLGNLSVIKACFNHINTGVETKIVFFSGGGAANGFPEFSGYSLSKVAVVREVENLGQEFDNNKYNASIIALAPGAVDTSMLKIVKKFGGKVNTHTDISEPTNFVFNYLFDKFDSKKLNGKFLHVRDEINSIDFDTSNKDIFKLRRIQ